MIAKRGEQRRARERAQVGAGLADVHPPQRVVLLRRQLHRARRLDGNFSRLAIDARDRQQRRFEGGRIADGALEAQQELMPAVRRPLHDEDDRAGPLLRANQRAA